MDQFLSKLKRSLNPDRTWVALVQLFLFAFGFYLATILENPASIVTGASGLVVAVGTYFLVTEARKTREVQTAPNISISLTQPNKRGLIYIVVKNDGEGTARNIQFSTMGDFQAVVRKVPLSETFFIKNGLSYLVPKQEFRVILNHDRAISYSESLTISVRYESETGKEYAKEFVNDFAILRDTIVEDAPLEKVSTEIKELRWFLKKTEREKRSGEVVNEYPNESQSESF
jgi:hypothetical protein